MSATVAPSASPAVARLAATRRTRGAAIIMRALLWALAAAAAFLAVGGVLD